MMKKRTTINERILYIIDNQLNGNQKKFAEKINFAPQVIHNIISGRKSKPSFDVLNAIISSFVYISAEWLLTGEGEMLKNPAKQEEPVQQVAEERAPYGNNTYTSYEESNFAMYKRELSLLMDKIQLLQENKALLEDKVKSLEERESNRIQELEAEIARLTQENHAIKSQPQNRKTG